MSQSSIINSQSEIVLPTAFFGSVAWYRELMRRDAGVFIEAHETYQKQTTRNHCLIATANGVQKLTVPVTIPKTDREGQPTKNAAITDIFVSDHGNWRHQHWEALSSSYGMSPFFEFYEDEIRPFFSMKWEKLFDYNLAITEKMLSLLTQGKAPAVATTEKYYGVTPYEESTTPYYQTFQRRHGFIAGLSILDLLFNLGPEAALLIGKEQEGLSSGSI